MPTRTRPPAATIEVLSARGLGAFQDGERQARSGAWREAEAAYRAAIEAGAPGAESWTRLAMACLVLGDREGYVTACRQLVDRFGRGDVAPRTANNVAWS